MRNWARRQLEGDLEIQGVCVCGGGGGGGEEGGWRERESSDINVPLATLRERERTNGLLN